METNSSIEDCRKYAQNRANKTGMKYMMSTIGHVMLDTPGNRKVMEELECPMMEVFKPQPVRDA